MTPGLSHSGQESDCRFFYEIAIRLYKLFYASYNGPSFFRGLGLPAPSMLDAPFGW